jgi:hypothetical protein
MNMRLELARPDNKPPGFKVHRNYIFARGNRLDELPGVRGAIKVGRKRGLNRQMAVVGLNGSASDSEMKQGGIVPGLANGGANEFQGFKHTSKEGETTRGLVDFGKR